MFNVICPSCGAKQLSTYANSEIDDEEGLVAFFPDDPVVTKTIPCLSCGRLYMIKVNWTPTVEIGTIKWGGIEV